MNLKFQCLGCQGACQLFRSSRRRAGFASLYEETNLSNGVVTSFCCKRYRKILLLRRREFRPGPNGMGFMTKLEDVKEESRILALLDHPRCLKLKEILDSNPDSADGKVYISQQPVPVTVSLRVFPRNNPPPLIFDVPTGGVRNPLGGALMVLKSVRDDDSERGCMLESDASASLPTEATQDGLREKFIPQLKTLRTFTEAQAKCFIRDAAEGLAYLHEDLGVCHRDLKVDNLLLGADGRVCIGDFGSAEKMNANGKVRHTKGTYMFMAPECLRPVDESKPYEGHDGRAADAWALGVCAYVMVFGTVPFVANSIESLFEAIGEGIVKIPENPPISPELQDFFRRVLHPEWKGRLSVRQILAHPWVTSANDADASAYAQALLQQHVTAST